VKDLQALGCIIVNIWFWCERYDGYKASMIGCLILLESKYLPIRSQLATQQMAIESLRVESTVCVLRW